MKKSLKDRITARFRRNPFFSEMLDLTGSTLKPQQWVFIIGCYNSGTTLLHDILALHSDIGVMNDEGVMLTDTLPRPEDFGWRRMWVQCEPEMNPPLNEKSAKRIKKHWSHFFQKEKYVFLEKSISNTVRIPFLREYFQPVKFIHIVRNGYAVAEGIQRKARVMPPHNEKYGSHYPLSLCTNQWVRSLELVNEYKMNDIFEIKYEELTKDPSSVIAQICEFLEVDPAFLQIKHEKFTIHGNESQIRNMNEGSISRLTLDERQVIEELSQKWLLKYGYK